MKNFIFTIILCIYILFNIPIQAEASAVTISFLTESTVDIISSVEPRIDEDVITITKEIIFSETIYPDRVIAWTEIISGIPYVGTLYLQSFYHSGGKTVATYCGDLVPQ